MEYSKKIIDEKFILNLFRNLYKIKRVPIIANNTMACMVVKDRKGKEILLDDFEYTDSLKDKLINIGFFYNETFYNFKSKIIPRDSLNTLEKPLEISATYKRQLNRHELNNDENVFIRIAGQENEFIVKNISTKGLAFEGDIELKVGSIINNIEIIIEDLQVLCLDASVKYCNSHGEDNIYGLSFVDIDWFNTRALFSYIFKNSFPSIKILTEFDKENIRKLFEAYLEKMPEALANLRFDEMINTMDNIKSNREISANLVYVKDDGKLISTASALRIYNRTFLGHQLVAIPQSVTNLRSKADIYYSLSDYIINNKYFEYYISYYVTLLSWHDLMFQRIENYINDKNKFSINKLQFFTYSTSSGSENNNENYMVELINDPTDFVEYCKKHLEPIEIDAYFYEKDFYLNEIGQVYEALGLYIIRKLWGVKRDGSIVAYIVSECGSNGLNLFNLIDMARFIFVNEADKQNIIESSLEQLSKYYLRYQKSNFNVVYASETNDISIKDLIPNQAWAKIIMNKEGGIEYEKIIKLLI